MPPDPLDTLRYFQQLRKISIEFKVSSNKEIAQESYISRRLGVEALREPWGRAALIQCARDLIEQRCYISSYQSYSSIRTFTNYEDCFKTVTLEVESEQNSAFFTNSGRSQYSIASRFCISGFEQRRFEAAQRKKLQ